MSDKVANANKIIEIYILEIQYCTLIQDFERLKEIYHAVKDIFKRLKI